MKNPFKKVVRVVVAAGRKTGRAVKYVAVRGVKRPAQRINRWSKSNAE